MGKTFSKVVIVVLLLTILWVIQYLFKITPLQFFFISTILVSVFLFFFNYNNEIIESDDFNLSETIRAAPLNIICLLIIYLLSLFVLKIYLLPTDDSSYFTNASTHGIKNHGFSFKDDDGLIFYEPTGYSGIRKSENGTFKITKTDSNFSFQFDHLSHPVFVTRNNKKKASFIVNPQYETISDQSGFDLGEYHFRFTEFSGNINKDDPDEIPAYSFLLEITSDVDSLFDKTKPFRIKFSDDDFPLKRNLRLRSVISQMEPINDSDSLALKQYEQLSKVLRESDGHIYFVNQEVSGQLALGLFVQQTNQPTYEIKIFLSPKSQNTTYNYVQDSGTYASQFYVGVNEWRRPLMILKDTMSKESRSTICFDYPDYHPLTILDSLDRPGMHYIRFLRNNFQIDTLEANLTREGYVFHDELPVNKLTNINGWLSYKNGEPSKELNVKIIQNNYAGEIQEISCSNGPSSFFKLKNGSDIEWIFEIRDFAQNRLSFRNTATYLTIITLLFLFLILFKPSVSMRRVELPLLLIVYSFIVFRYILLWRISTFPPMEGITKSEFSTYTDFEFNFLNLGVTSTLLWITAFIAFLCFWRSSPLLRIASFLAFLCFWRPKILTRDLVLNKLKQFFQHKKKYTVLITAIVLYLIFIIVDLIFPGYSRFWHILFPVIVYFTAIFIIIDRENSNFSVNNRSVPEQPLHKYLFQLFSHWIETPVFWLSFVTLVFFFLFDKGFAIIFLFFLLLKSTLVYFSRSRMNDYDDPNTNKIVQWIHPSNFKIYGLVSFLLFICLIIRKSFFADILSNINLIIVFSLFASILAAFILTPTFKWKKQVFIFIGIGLIISFLFARLVDFRPDEILKRGMRNTIYRTLILNNDVDEILYRFEYDSREEQKLMETALNQWYIKNYNFATKDPDRLIHLRPHFNIGVDYSTQTRDVVIPRYIISEFGNWVMGFCIVLVALPLFFYFIHFSFLHKHADTLQLYRKYEISSDALVGFAALALFATIGIFVWLASTDRIAFFGQDFPFLSLTSRLSVLLPLSLIAIALCQNPVPRDDHHSMVGRYVENQWRNNLFKFLVFTGTVFLIIAGIPDKSTSDSSDKQFRLEFTKLRRDITEINLIAKKLKLNQYSFDQADFMSPSFRVAVNDFFSLLKQNNDYQQIKNQYPYLQSILNRLEKDSANIFRFRSNSPVYVQYDDITNRFIIRFNNTLHLENPPYEIKNVWKGDILTDQDNTPLLDDTIRQIPTRHPALKLFRIPSRYFPDQTAKGIFFLGPTSTNEHLNKFLIISTNPKDHKRSIRNFDKPTFNSIILNDNDFIIDLSDGNAAAKSRLTGIGLVKNSPAFAKSFIINGKHRFIYPLEEKFPWIQRWAESIQEKYKKGEFQTDTSFVTLDYHLTEQVSSILNDLKNDSLRLKGSSFSVISADGNGRINLMSDFIHEREPISPNNLRRMYEKMEEDKFFYNAKKEALQWGNKNLIQMDLGPGSSFKPLVYAAVTSGLMDMDWANLHLVNAHKTDSKNGIDFYAGHPISRYKGKGWLEEKSIDDPEITPIEYITNSNNLYHSLIMFLGNYRRNDFPNNSIKDQLISPKDTSNRNFFPQMQIGQNNYFFPNWRGNQLQKWPQTNLSAPGYFLGSDVSLLHEGLMNHLKLKTEYDLRAESNNIKSEYAHDPVSGRDSINTSVSLAYPDFSFFPVSEMSLPKSAADFRSSFINPVKGSRPFQITAYKMAEMFGNLASLNSNYTLHIEPKNPKPLKNWDLTGSGWSLDQYKAFHSKNLMEGMRSVLTNGTLKSLGLDSSKYFLYAKTGTTGSGMSIDYKRLAVIISKYPLHEGAIPDNNRFYTVFFVFEKALDDEMLLSKQIKYKDYYRRILNAIIRSKSFQRYMN
jgi:membrane protein implicated in regulation of membrane protease activity